MAQESLHIAQSSTLPPAQPAYVLRGHSAQVHSLHFLRQNLRLLSGDADGWVVLWGSSIKRPVAVWRAHKGTVLGLGRWGDDKIITHGRDNKLCVWQLRDEDEAGLSKTLPVNDPDEERKQPWLLHSLPVNALNFCSFAMCLQPSPQGAAQTQTRDTDTDILIATPGVQDGHVNVTSLPSEERVATIIAPKDVKTGMLMAVGLHYQGDRLYVLAGYESGYTCVFTQQMTGKQWQAIYTNKSHSQPILSLDIAPKLGYFYTSSADAVIAKHPLGDGAGEAKIVQTKHAGQQSLTVRSDEKIFATAGWDGRVRVYSAKTMKELAVLKWHKEGCYALAFAEVSEPSQVVSADGSEDGAVAKRDLIVSERRMQETKNTHWLGAGSKDGKVSLWDVY